MENPVYYVQYAHARIASIGRQGGRARCRRGCRSLDASTSRRSCTSASSSCCARSRRTPSVLAEAAELRAPHRVTTWVRDFAKRVPRLLPRLPGHHRRRRAHPGAALAGGGVPARPGRARSAILGVQRARRDGRGSTTTTTSDGDAGALTSTRSRAAPFDRDARRRAGAAIDGSTSTRSADEFGTPLFVYDEDRPAAALPRVRRRVRRRARGVRGQGVPLHRDGAARRRGGAAPRRRHRRRAPRRAARPGSRPTRIVFHGNNKSDAEIATGARRRRRPDRRRLVRRARPARGAGRGCGARRACSCASRPGVEAHTHEYIETGTDDSKFGFTVSTGARPRRRARVAESRRAAASAGSTATSARRSSCSTRTPAAARRRRELAAECRARDRRRDPELNLGGGLGAPLPRRRSDARASPSSRESTTRRRRVRDAGLGAAPRSMVEPGRSIAAPAGVTLYRVGTIKEIPGVAHLRRGRRRDERQPPPGRSTARATRRSSPRRIDAPRPLGRHRRGQALRAGRRPRRATRTCPPTSRSATCSSRRSPARTATRWRRNYNMVPRPAVVFVRDGERAGRRAARDVRRPRATGRGLRPMHEMRDCQAVSGRNRRIDGRAGAGRDCSAAATSGGALVRLIHEHADVIEARAGVPLEVARVAVRDLAQGRATCRCPPAASPTTPRGRGRRSRRRHRRRGHRRHRAGPRAHRRGARWAASPSSPPTRSCSPPTAASCSRPAEGAGVDLLFEASVGGWHPADPAAARVARRRPHPPGAWASSTARPTTSSPA